MELDEISLSKTLHYMIEKFISCMKHALESETLDSNKIFNEISKRCESVSQDLRSIAIYAHTALETSDVLSIKVLLDDKIQTLTHNLLQQDFLELSLNCTEELFISEYQLHNLLHSGAMRDITSLTPSSLEQGQTFGFHFPLYDENTNTIYETSVDKNFNSLLPSTQFENSKKQFEDELTDIKRIFEHGFSTSDLNAFNVATILKYEDFDVVQKRDVQPKGAIYLDVQNKSHQPQASLTKDCEIKLLNDSDFEDSVSFRSWEGCLGTFLRDHSYISEITPEVALLSISEKESQAYYSLLNPVEAISEYDMAHDILDMLIGIPSDTFFYDIHARKFRMKSVVHLRNLSTECTARIVATFIEAGSIFYLLHKFSKDSFHSCEGLVFKGLQLGVQQILSMYKKYIIAVKVSSPNMLFLRTDVAENAELLQTFGTICGIDSEKMVFGGIPKGLGLLSYLHDVARSHKRKENGIMIAVLLKYAYAPYFSFLNKWITEGICNDPYEEFQIMEDLNYLGRRDALYWKFAYTENIDDPARAVPPEIKSYSPGILDCGKSIGLLKICCPEIFSLKYLFCKPPPSLSMVCSFPAAIHKLRESAEYILLKEKAEEIYDDEMSELCVDQFYIQCQKYVSKGIMINMIQRKWNILLATDLANSNILNFTQVKHYIKKCKPTKNTDENLKSCKKRWHSVDTLDIQNNDKNFSGTLHGNIGLLFSSCGYKETIIKSDFSPEEIELNFISTDFSRQLDLMSYTEVHESNLWKTLRSRCKDMFSMSEMEFLNSVRLNNNLLKGDLFSSKNIENSCPVEQNNYITDDFLSNLSFSQESKSRDTLSLKTISEKKNTAVWSFMEKLISLLVSEYGDSIDDVYSFIQATSLQRLMMHNFNAVLKMRIHLVEKTIMKYVVKQLGLDSLLSTLQSIYFFQDATFSQSLCEQLFPLVMKCRTPREFADWTVFNEILSNAVSDANQENNPLLANLSVNVPFISEEMPTERTGFLRLFIIEFEVNWPLNIIVHQTCMQQYLKIFSMLLEIEFLCWLLGRSWRNLITTSKNLHLDNTPQFRSIMLSRFDMEQFIRIIRNSIHQHLQGPLWEFLKKNLSVEESSIDSLENVHMQYLEKALARCFLTDETHALHELISVMFRQIYKFCNAVFECDWEQNSKTGYYETFEFKRICTSFETFRQYQKVFLKRIMKETLTKKCGRYWDKDYQEFLETIWETERNIS